LFVLLFALARFQTQFANLDSVVPDNAATPPTNWEQLEEHMKRLDPAKASRWKEFLKEDPKRNVIEIVDVSKQPAALSSATELSFDVLDDQRAQFNSRLVREWRHNFQQAAGLPDGDEHRARANKYAESGYRVSNLRKCKHVFIDFGSNIGDSLLKMIDSFFPEFDSGKYRVKEGQPRKRYHSLNITTGNIGPTFYDGYRGNPIKWILPKWVNSKISDYNTHNKKQNNGKPEVFPEDYCFYGIEGNPHFTSLLREHEIQVMNMIPRPVRHAHFLTGHVGCSIDGPTTLYLDTKNVKENFWGSSIIKSHIDVVQSEGDTAVPVMGITLTKLLEQTVLPGGHVMIKIDIEGGEYQLLEEAINSTILCKLIKEQDVRIDMLNEPHDAKIVGSAEPGNRWKAVQGEKMIKQCGVGYGWGGRQF
jgi:hypothetical protein